MHIFVYDFLDAGLQFFTAMGVVAHAVAGLTFAEQAATRLGSNGLTRDGSARWVDDIDVEESSQRMLFLDAAGHALGFEQWQLGEGIGFETRLETALEGERFFDLVRWGIAAETMNRYFEVEKGKRVYYQGVKFTPGRDEYFPVPLTQYNLTRGAYVQNPGYGSF